MAALSRRRKARPDPEAWGLSLLVHALLLIWLFFWPRPELPLVLPTPEPLVVALVDLGGPAGDTTRPLAGLPAPGPVQARPAAERPAPADAPAPRPEAAVRRPVVSRPAARPARAPADPDPRQAEPEPQVDALALERERQRRRLAESALPGAGEGPSQPDGQPGGASGGAPGGAVSTGTGARGDLAGRRILERPEPDYPQEARARLAEGSVRAVIRVSASGEVVSARIQRSSGDGTLDAAALAAFQRWRFSPLAGDAPDQEGYVSVRFQLR